MADIVGRCGRILLDTIVVLVVLALLPGIPPHLTYTTYEVDGVRPLEGALALNHKLDSVDRILDGKIVGPESIASRKDNEIFVSLHGGKILRIWGELFDHYQAIAAIGPGCEGKWQEQICGRPLGLRFAPDGKLLVADAYLGLFAVDVNTGEKERLFDPLLEIGGVAPKLIDDLDIDSDGNIYWSDASSIADLANGVMEMMSDPTGRLIKFDPLTKTNTVLLKNVHFANGVQLSPDHDFVLVSETFKNRVLRHWLKGPKAGTTDVFVDRLPGMPDNLRSKDNGYYIALVSIKNTEKFDMHNFLAKLPFIRKLIVRFVYIVKLMFDGISNLYPNQLTEKISYNIFHLEPIAQNLSGNLSIIVEVDSEGTIVDSLQGNTGKIRFISEAKQVGDNIFFGSPYNKFLGRLYTGIPSIEVDGKGVRMKTGDDAQVETEKATPEVEPETGKAKQEVEAETEKVTQEVEAETEKVTQGIEAETEKVTQEIEAETEKVTQEIEAETEKVTQEIEAETEKVTQEVEAETEKVTQEIEAETEKVTQEIEAETEKVTQEVEAETEKVTQEVEAETETEERQNDPEVQVTSTLEDLPKKGEVLEKIQEDGTHDKKVSTEEEDIVEEPKEGTLDEQRVVIEGEVKQGVPEDTKAQESVQVNIVNEDVDVKSTGDEEGQQQTHVESEEVDEDGQDNYSNKKLGDGGKTSKRDEL